ncbi:MAG TPA: MBL fold metallo-hydrolase [Gaiellaceae bacterium]|nr:MBL fold metallo-hydrolase [Gaiellaceae bacterium]
MRREWGEGEPTWRSTEIARDVIQVSIPRLHGFVNVYLIRGDHGWTLVDAAERSELSRLTLLDFFDRRGILDDGIEQVLLTHGHPDHVGLAAEIAARTGARLIAHSATFEGHRIDPAFLRRHGLDVQGNGRGTGPVAAGSDVEVIGDGALLVSGKYRFRLIGTPGHHAGHLCAFDPASGLLLSGDRILRIPTGVARYTARDDDPLADHLRSYETLRTLGARLILPGHGRVFSDGRAALEHDRRAHQVDLRLVLQATPVAGADAVTITEATRRLAADVNRGTIAEAREDLAVTRVLAVLRFLEHRGSVESDPSVTPVAYRRTDGGGRAPLRPERE